MVEKIPVGVCIGASTVSIVAGQNSACRTWHATHRGKPKDVFAELMSKAGIDAGYRLVVTGRDLRKTLGYSHVTEPEAIQRALDEFPQEQRPQAVVSSGGQTTIVYELDRRGQIIQSHTFNKCGSGTGEFFLQQIKRVGFDSVKKAVAVASEPEALMKPYVSSARCSVFCKSDCTHALNDGKATPGQIVAGLCRMMAEKIVELLARIKAQHIWLIGGVTQITPVTDHLRSTGLRVTVPAFATCFEAWGASLIAADNKTPQTALFPILEKRPAGVFNRLPPLEQFRDLVIIKKSVRALAVDGDKCLLAVDAGSTTTKLVIVRLSDMAILADWYGWTLGKPHEATLLGLRSVKEQLKGADVKIAGIITTGSGRNLVEAFLTDYGRKDDSGRLVPQVVACNEITCHARAAESLNPGVSCVLEIGGQDAKYTHLENGVPIDFCMNEACSAGTGSFMEETVHEQFGVSDCREIAPLAIESRSPIAFGEQCSAFIETDISAALQQGAQISDVIAGLCYSICANYLNRVVGSRPIHGTISLQGGTAYNRAFCLAMAGTLKLNGTLSDGETLIVSQDAGLMGALGGALELKFRIDRGYYQPISTTIDSLIGKRLETGQSFTCRACDYHCEIRRFVIDGHTIPFGGFCEKYNNLRRQTERADTAELDLVASRDQLLWRYSDFGSNLARESRTVGLLGNLFDLTYLPFYTNFFSRLGFRVVLADAVDPEGVRRQGASFCWPIERVHGQLFNLMAKKSDFYFLPHLKAVAMENTGENTRHCCPFVQSLPYLLGSSFPEIPNERILKPYLDLSLPWADFTRQLQVMAVQLGTSNKQIAEASAVAWAIQDQFKQACLAQGRRLLAWLAQDPDRLAFVMVGRSYNALSGHLASNKGISRKIASQGITAVPMDFLPTDQLEPEVGMFWSAGQAILKTARYISSHDWLFGVYLTNFSCGPDSFINYKFRHYMGAKPSLTLEFDEHTANAGFDTRVEAFRDIVAGYRRAASVRPAVVQPGFRAASLDQTKSITTVISSSGRIITLKNPTVRLVYPDMGRWGSPLLAAVTESLGVNSVALPPANLACLQTGRRESSCKECLPYALTLGSIIHYADQRPKDEMTVFFMPDGTGPCRFGQYSRYIQLAIERLRLENLALISLTPTNRYSGFGNAFSERAWIAIAVSGVMENIANALRTLAVDPEAAQTEFRRCHEQIRKAIARGVNWKNFSRFRGLLQKVARELGAIPLKRPLASAPKILITGEIYVRLAALSSEPIIKRLSEEGFVVVQEPAINWIKYIDEMTRRNTNPDFQLLSKTEWVTHKLRLLAENAYETLITKALSGSGLVDSHVDHISEFIKAAESRISPMFGGEAILTVGSAIGEAFNRFAGIVVLGPFGCMPTRIASGILTYAATGDEKVRQHPDNPTILKLAEQFPRIPVLVYESDGASLPPITLSQLSVFSMVARKVGERMLSLQ